MALLEIRDLKVSYGFITALKGVNIDVEQGQIVALLGSNGAGKTTTLRTISGVIKPQAGKIILDGKEVQGKSTYKVSKECASLGVLEILSYFLWKENIIGWILALLQKLR